MMAFAGKVPIIKARINPDLVLWKNTGGGNQFKVFGSALDKTHSRARTATSRSGYEHK